MTNAILQKSALVSGIYIACQVPCTQSAMDYAALGFQIWKPTYLAQMRGRGAPRPICAEIEVELDLFSASEMGYF